VGSVKKERADYDGWEIFRKSEKTIVRGNIVFDNGKIIKVGI